MIYYIILIRVAVHIFGMSLFLKLVHYQLHSIQILFEFS
jgi:hypothetical protein